MKTVIVALTTDAEILAKKGYKPELNYEQRREILEAIKYVDEVVPSPWLLDKSFLDLHKRDLLVHGHDNTNPINLERLLVLPKAKGISSNLLRSKVLKSVSEIIAAKEESA